MQIRLVFLFLCCIEISVGQGRVLPISSQFKDMSFAAGATGSAVFPKEDADINLYSFVQDSSKRFSIVGHYLFQRELIEIKDETGKIWITPLFDLSAGVELNDTLPKRIQNTRGARIEGVLGKRLFFTSSFYENQAILPNYVSDYVRNMGNFIPIIQIQAIHK